MGNRVFTQTEYSGSVASFTGTEGSSITSLIANIAPIQDLHGYAKPWPAGGGVNKFDISSVIDGAYISSSGVITEDSLFMYSRPISVNSGNSYTLSFTALDDNITRNTRIHGYDAGGNWVQQLAAVQSKDSTQHIVSFTIPSTVVTVRISIRNTFTQIQVEEGAYTSYAPYSNICPISGRTGLSVYRTGKNLFDESVFANYGGVLQADGVWRFNYVSMLLNQVIYTPPIGYTGQLTIVFMRKTEEGRQSLRFYINYTDGTNERIGTSFATGGMDVYTLTTDASKVVKNIMGDYGSNLVTYVNLMVSIQGTATAYEPYNGNTYSVDWTTEAGTVYGGTLDVVTGVLTVDWASVDLGTLNWSMIGSTNKYFQSDALIGSIKPPVNSSTLANAICEEYKCVTWSDHTYESGRFAVNGDPTPSRGKISFINTNYASAADFKTAMSGIKLVYELATPLTYQLTPQEVAVLVGQNNVWSNAGGSVDVIVSSPLQGFHGWLIKVKQGNNLVEIPLTFIRAETYTVTPDQRLEWSAERDVTGVLHRETTENTPPKIEFETPLMTNTDIHALNTIIQNGFTNTLGRDVTIQFYNPEKNEYWQWDCYMPDVHYNIRNVDTAHNVINYEQLRYAFIGY